MWLVIISINVDCLRIVPFNYEIDADNYLKEKNFDRMDWPRKEFVPIGKEYEAYV